MPSVQRHTQIDADALRTNTISAAEAARILAPKAIPSDAMQVLKQYGTAHIGTTRVVTFPVAFSNTPAVVLTPLGSTDMTALAGVEGSAYVYGIHDVVGGSFQCYATPTADFSWTAIGSA